MTLNAIIGRLFGLLGLQVSRLPDTRVKNGRLTLEGFVLETDNRELIRSYRDHPWTNRIITRVVAHLAAERPEMTMIDVGANCGDSAALAKAAAESLPILCIEPDPHVFAYLERNIRGLSHVEAASCYLGESASKHEAYTVTKSGWNTTLVAADKSDSSAAVQFSTLDEVAASWAGREQLGFLKCDTEGFDVRVLFGALDLLSSRRPAVLFEYNRESMSAGGEDGFRVFAMLEGLGYGPVLFYDAYGRLVLAADLRQHDTLRDLHDYAEALMGKVLYYDVLVFHQDDAAGASRFIDAERALRRRISSFSV